MAYKILLLFVGVLLFLTCSSEDNTTGPDDSGNNESLFKVTVLDTFGLPVESLRVGSMNHSKYILPQKSAQDTKVSTIICLSFPEAGSYNMAIMNYYQDTVKEFTGIVNNGGTHCITWDTVGLRSGFYIYELVFHPNSGGQINDSKAVVLETGQDPQQSIIGITDSKGEFETDDTLLFPCLLGDPPTVFGYNESGSKLYETDDFYQDTVTITLSDPNEPTKFMKFKRALEVGPNAFNFIWDPKLAE